MDVVLVFHVATVTLRHIVTIDLFLCRNHLSSTFTTPLLEVGGFVSLQLLPVFVSLWTRRAFVDGSEEFDWKGSREGESDPFVNEFEMD